MSILKNIAGHAMTVDVAGETIRLKLPTSEAKAAALATSVEIKGESEEDRIIRSSRLVPLCLAATVCDDSGISAEEWSQIVTAADDEEVAAQFPGLVDLVEASMTLCGLKVTVEKRKQDRVKDHVDETAEALGTVPSE